MAWFSIFSGKRVDDEPVQLMFSWRRFRFPSFKFCWLLLAVVVLHLVAFYLFELASPERGQTLRNDARVLMLRSSDPMANRVLLAHSEALNAFDVSAGSTGKLDSGVRLTPSFDDYELSALPMPVALEELEGERFPSLLDGVVTELAPLADGVAELRDGRPAQEWQVPTQVRLVRADGVEVVIDVDGLDDAFWKAHFGRTVSFELRVDRHGVVTGAIGDRAVAEVVTAMRRFLIGAKLPLEQVEPGIWQSWQLRLW
ncbi:hypothetical protein [Sulfuriroseicoccus oceanibius]|uniref:Uncharacterized protein n=1 Tax=Sulfuriroseicoccus oceanibius TaxID=2707525 RepID=A0A6B3L0Z8_9BACT|nr:hypothetical protein [Sulfuriroseicoccus oceanibius]QQL46305.1 hypothetical protein G3M56_006955 [Sulfuriroseicoccus oceanibius]